MKPYVGCGFVGVSDWAIHLSERICRSFHLPRRSVRSPNRARSRALIHMPPPQCAPPETDWILLPPILTHELSYPCQTQVFEAPIGSIRYCFKTSGSGRRHTISAA